MTTTSRARCRPGSAIPGVVAAARSGAISPTIPTSTPFYYSTGNCGPWNPDYRREWGVVNLDANGGLIDYRNNWCASQMARDATTGELIWAYNITPADPWDIDEPINTPLVDRRRQRRWFGRAPGHEGRPLRPFLCLGSQSTGELLAEPWPFVYTDAITGVDMATGRALYDITRWTFTDAEDRARYTDYQMPGAADRDDFTGTEVDMCPGNSARNWENDTFSDQTGLFYVSTDNTCFTEVVFEGEYVAGEGYTLRRSAGINPNGAARALDGSVTDCPVRCWRSIRSAAISPGGSISLSARASRSPAPLAALCSRATRMTARSTPTTRRPASCVWSFQIGSQVHASPDRLHA